ncbi:MAG: sigma 54-interacting transcriptional regulator [Deltaproteobacteria bacterium]|nr:sigma 54-interacting transcriptional regulator [Deltaproteobacteria bacterium]
MALSDVLCLSRAGEPVRMFPLGAHALEVGSHPDCDIAVHASGVPGRALLVLPAGGTVYLYDLVTAPGLTERSVMPIDRRVSIGAGYSIARCKASVEPSMPVSTELLDCHPTGPRPIALVQGRGREAQAFRIADRPLSIGAASDNAITLSDRAVSRFHCRIEPSEKGVFVRDLGSTNGTWVDGVRIQRIELRAGGTVRIGRTEFRVASGRRSETFASATPVVASSAMLAIMAEVDRFARLPWPALIHGETGVGKELVARALHERSPRSGGPFVALNGGGLPRDLIESELFGHERGAFTGAVQSHRGAFEQAHGGTLFLDEVAELPPALQTRLLRVLETWHVRRIGSESARRVNVRLVCATHRDLRRMVQEGSFRADLYYRIHRLVIDVPALRHRTDDIGPLAEHFLSSMAEEVGEKQLSAEAVWRLRAYPWPGNVRELRNALELAAIGCDTSTIDADVVDRALRRLADPVARPTADTLRRAIEAYGGNLSAAARALGIPRSTLRDRFRDASARDDAR